LEQAAEGNQSQTQPEVVGVLGGEIRTNPFSLISRDTANQSRTVNHRHITTWHVFHTTLHAQLLTATFDARRAASVRVASIVHTDVMLQNVMTKAIFLLPSPLPTTPPRASGCWTLAANHTQTTIVARAMPSCQRTCLEIEKQLAQRECRPSALTVHTHAHARTPHRSGTGERGGEGRGMTYGLQLVKPTLELSRVGLLLVRHLLDLLQRSVCVGGGDVEEDKGVCVKESGGPNHHTSPLPNSMTHTVREMASVRLRVRNEQPKRDLIGKTRDGSAPVASC
jgi:hypothetical protein